MKALFDKADPSGALRPGEPSDRDGRATGRVAFGDEPARSRAHFGPGHAGLGGDAFGCDIVDHRDDRLFPSHFAHHRRQAVIGHRAQDHGIKLIAGTALKLFDLTPKVGITTGFKDVEPDAQTACLFHHAMVDREPIGILQMGVKHAKAPRLLRPLQGDIVCRDRGAGVVKRDRAHFKLKRVGGFGLTNGQHYHDQSRKTDCPS